MLKLFQCEFNRMLEEDFAQILAERGDLRLFFVNENQAFTDGKNIIVDPAYRELFADMDALHKTERMLHLEPIISQDKWLALRMVTRAQNIHETLHILYSNFPSDVSTDKRGTNKVRRLVLSLICNIIEDAFIEAAGSSVYDNLERFFIWYRMVQCCSIAPSQGTVNRAFSVIEPTSKNEHSSKALPIVTYLNYMVCKLLYPMISQDPPSEELCLYVEKTEGLFLEGSICGNADERYVFTQKAFDIIEPLIPKFEDVDYARLEHMLAGSKQCASNGLSVQETSHKGKTAAITRRLFTDLEGNPISMDGLNQALKADLVRFLEEKAAALKIVAYMGSITRFTGTDFDCANIHKGIAIEATKPQINLNLKKAYRNLWSRYHINISAYSSRFSQLLNGIADTREDKYLFGSGITSKRMGDVKKRFWYRNVQGVDMPELALLLLIDGSGSMSGERRNGALISSVILHEVLKKNRIEHAIVEHRAIYNTPLLKHNILVDFNAREEEKYNLLTLQAEEGTREGLSLYWAERYLQEHSHSVNKLILMLSDGVPAHGLDGDACYLPPVSIKDTHNAARKIVKRGTHIIAIALDISGGDDCYCALKEIYPFVVSCTDINRLTGQLLALISKGLS